MPLKKRLLIYLLLFVLYFILSSGIAYSSAYISDLYLFAYACFIASDIIIARLFLKTGPVASLLTGIAIGGAAFFIASQLSDLNIVQHYDAYGIRTVIFGNIIFSLLLWEVAHQIKITSEAKPV